MEKKNPPQKFKKPWWQRRLERSIEQWRKDLGRVTEIRKGVVLKERVYQELERRYQLSERGTTTVVSFLKNKIQAASSKIKNLDCIKSLLDKPRTQMTHQTQRKRRLFGKIFGGRRVNFKRNQLG